MRCSTALSLGWGRASRDVIASTEDQRAAAVRVSREGAGNRVEDSTALEK